MGERTPKQQLFDLHMVVMDLCIDDIITEDEHDQFNEWLDRVLERRNS